MLLALDIFILIFTLLAFFLNKKDILSPTFLFGGVLFVCCTFAIIGNQTWKMSISSLLIPVIAVGLLSGELGEQCARRGRSRLQKDVRFLANRTSKKRPRIIKINLLLFFFLFGIEILFVFLFYLKSLDLAISIGYKPGKPLLQYIRVATSVNGLKYGIFFAIVNPFVSVFSYLSVFMFLNNAMIKTRRNAILKNSYLLLPLIPFFVYLYFTAVRMGFIEFFLSMFLIFVFCMQRSDLNYPKWKFILIVGIAIVAVFLIFVIMGKNMKKVGENVFASIVLYAGSSLCAFSQWLEKGNVFLSNYFGQETFYGFWNFLSRFFDVPEGTKILEFVNLGESISNIYTCFRSYLADFGVIGLVVFPFLTHFFMTRGKMGLKKKHTLQSVVLYSYFFAKFINQVFACELTNCLLTSSQIFFLLWTVALCNLIRIK